MTFRGAMIEEQGVTFAVLSVAQGALQDVLERDKLLAAFKRVFRGIPIVLVSQDSPAVPMYYGRSDILNFLADIPLAAIPWEDYRVDG